LSNRRSVDLWCGSRGCGLDATFVHSFGATEVFPPEDADRFLLENGIEKFFSAVVTMEDAPLKPDPRPIRLALERLGVRHAWMVGDTPDDIRAARSAAVLPIGCRAPGDAAVADSALHEAGAAHILTTVDQLEGVLP
jgi:phosphoglycolate phosphatase-like HAD superfamily hydrolase